jgi:hypothetical protein
MSDYPNQPSPLSHPPAEPVYGDQLTDKLLAAQGAFVGPALEALPEAKVVALEQAVELCRQDRDSTAKEVVEVAETFEAYLTGKEEQQP